MTVDYPIHGTVAAGFERVREGLRATVSRSGQVAARSSMAKPSSTCGAAIATSNARARGRQTRSATSIRPRRASTQRRSAIRVRAARPGSSIPRRGSGLVTS